MTLMVVIDKTLRQVIASPATECRERFTISCSVLDSDLLGKKRDKQVT
jgi:hypothetical protein